MKVGLIANFSRHHFRRHVDERTN